MYSHGDKFLPTSSLSLAAVFLQDTQSESAVQGLMSGVRVTPLVSSPPLIKAASIGLDAMGSTPRPVSENPTSSKVHLTQPFPASVNTSPKTGSNCLHNDAISKGPAATAVSDAVPHASACSVEAAAVAESQTKAGSLQGAAGNSSTSAAVAAVTQTGCSDHEPSADEEPTCSSGTLGSLTTATPEVATGAASFTQHANSGADSTAVGAPDCQADMSSNDASMSSAWAAITNQPSSSGLSPAGRNSTAAADSPHGESAARAADVLGVGSAAEEEVCAAKHDTQQITASENCCGASEASGCPTYLSSV